MVSITLLKAVLLVAGASFAAAQPVDQANVEVLQMRASTTVHPDAVTNTKCIDSSV
jgi:hypothetical protein